MLLREIQQSKLNSTVAGLWCASLQLSLHLQTMPFHKFILWEEKQERTLHLPSGGDANGAWWNQEPSKTPFASPQDGKCKFCQCLWTGGRHIKVQLHVWCHRPSICWISRYYLGSCASNFEWISNVMVREETSAFSLPDAQFESCEMQFSWW